MKLYSLRPIMYTEDLGKTIAFYCDILGFTCHARNDECKWASLDKDDVSIMLAGPYEHTKYDKIGFTGSFYFNTDNVEGLWAELKDKVKVCYDIETFPSGMREFAVYDNNGYVLQFGQEAAK